VEVPKTPSGPHSRFCFAWGARVAGRRKSGGERAPRYILIGHERATKPAPEIEKGKKAKAGIKAGTLNGENK